MIKYTYLFCKALKAHMSLKGWIQKITVFFINDNSEEEYDSDQEDDVNILNIFVK